MFIFNKIFLSSVLAFILFTPLLGDQALELAEKFFNSGNYYHAITEYKRFLFFNPYGEGTTLSYVYYKIGMAYINQELWDEGKEAFEKAIQAEKDERVRDERKIALAIAMIASSSYSEAEFLLLKVEIFSPIPELRRKSAFLRGISSIYSSKWKEAREAFSFYFKNSNMKNSEIYREVDSQLLKAQTLRYKSPKLAKVLSTVLPGAGQIYAGDWRNGINGLVLNLSIAYFLATELLQKRFQEFIFDALFLFDRFYQGNRALAEKSAKKYNQILNKRITEKIIHILQDKQ
ncbi:MAG: hypothetical protein AB1410_03655 [Acidobacteriota bacterium]